MAILLIAFVFLAGGSELVDIKDRIEHNKTRFANARFECVWREDIDQVYVDSIGFESQFVRGLLSDPDKRKHFENDGRAAGQFDGSRKIEQVLEDRLKDEVSGGGLEKKYVFSSGAILEVRQFDPDDSRRDQSKAKGLKPVTSDGFQVVQKTAGSAEWVSLEGYPHPGSRSPLGWKKKNLRLRCLVPPCWGDHTVSSEFDNGWIFFDGNLKDVIGPIKIDDESSLFARDTSDGYCLLYFTSERTKNLFPEWIAVVPKFTAKAITFDLASSFVEKMNKIEKIPQVFDEKMYPDSAVFYEGINQHLGGFHPRSVRYVMISQVRTRETASVQWRNRPYGISRRFELSFTAISAADSVEKLVIPDGTSFVDLDAQTASIVGESVERSLKKLVRNPPQRFNSFALVALTLFVVLVFTWSVYGRSK